jgi:hypothetical protein
LRIALWSGAAFALLLAASSFALPRVLEIAAQAGLFITAVVASIAFYVWIWTLAHSAGRHHGPD